MNKSLHNILKHGAISIALSAITMTSCYAATASKPATSEYKKTVVSYSCQRKDLETLWVMNIIKLLKIKIHVGLPLMVEKMSLLTKQIHRLLFILLCKEYLAV